LIKIIITQGTWMDWAHRWLGSPLQQYSKRGLKGNKKGSHLIFPRSESRIFMGFWMIHENTEHN
jgi:hypothetical protein